MQQNRTSLHKQWQSSTEHSFMTVTKNSSFMKITEIPPSKSFNSIAIKTPFINEVIYLKFYPQKRIHRRQQRLQQRKAKAQFSDIRAETLGNPDEHHIQSEERPTNWNLWPSEQWQIVASACGTGSDQNDEWSTDATG